MTDNAIPLPGVSTVTSITDWENLFSGGLWSGVIPGVGSGLAPSLNGTSRSAVIGTGAAIIRGFYKPVSASTSTAIPAASSQSRIDRLVLRLNRGTSDPTQFVVPTIIAGTPAPNPQEPALVQNPAGSGFWDLPIMSWTSASNGALTAMKDERYSPATVLSGMSTARPAMGGPGLLVENDTGMIAMWTGTAWVYVAQAPDTPHQIVNFKPNGWSGSLTFAKAAPGLVVVSAEISLGANANVADGTVICNISSSYAPATYHHVPLRCDALKVSPQSSSGSYESASLSFRVDGSVAVFGVGSAATVLEGTGCYPLSF